MLIVLMAVVLSISMRIPMIKGLFIAVKVAMAVVSTWVTEIRGDNGDKDAGVGADEHDDDGDGGGCGDEDDAGVG